jgi:tetratricopeptide (TPR) repeat protein
LSLYYKGEYQKSIDAFDTVIKLSPDNNDAYLLQAKDYIYLKDYKKAVELCDYVIKIKSDLQYAHGIKGWALYWDGKLSEALTSLNEAIKLDPKYETAYIHKTGVLYYQKKYQDCIDFADTAIILFPKNVQFLWYKSDCYYDSLEYEKSAKQLEEALNIESENEEIIIAIARIYYGLQEYDKSNEYTQKALNLNKNNKSAIELQGYLQDQKLPEREKIASFVERNYLYKDKVKDFDVKTKSFKAGKDLSTAEVGKYISSIKLPDDQFTFFISGNDYDEIKKAEEENQVISKQITDDSYYLTFNSFTPKIHIQFKNIIDKIENPSEKNLIIDMRNNMGGLTYVSNEILDYLLPACVTSYTIYRDGEIRTVYSNEEQIKFKKIIILVNENTASSAELLSMGLKQYLNNVVIIGKPTVGKGVGQFVYEDKEKKYMIYLVSFYWNVREKNVSVQKITPDIKITGTLEKSYLDEVMKQIKK